MKIKIFSQFFSEEFYSNSTSLWIHWIILLKISGKKKSLLPLLNWAVYSYPFSSRFVLIYMCEDHTSPHNHTDMLRAYFSFVISLKLEFFSKSLNYRLLAFPYLDVWPILFVQMKLAVLAPQSLCSADPFFSFSMPPEFVLYLQWLFCIWFNNKGIL